MESMLLFVRIGHVINQIKTLIIQNPGGGILGLSNTYYVLTTPVDAFETLWQNALCSKPRVASLIY